MNPMWRRPAEGRQAPAVRHCLWLRALLLVAPVVAHAAASRPNIVFILADDLGWSDTTLFGTTKFHRTPNIERLARRGMAFSRAYSASPLCSPTRAAILTGLSPARTGITSPTCHLPKVVLQATVEKSARPDQKSIMPESVTRLKTEYRTLAESLREAGYATGHFGKWHLGAEPYSPLQHGFDVDIPHWPGPGPAGSFVAPWKFKDFAPDPGVPDQHIEDRMAREAVAWMERNRNRPFFLNYWMFSVHAPFDAKRALIEKHRARVNPADPQRSPTYAAMVESMDDAVGTLLDALDRLNLADRTIIVFTSDNGGNMYNVVDGTTPTSNAPLRGGKATMFEGGTRVPCVIAWPGVTAAGSRSEVVLQSEDFYPTLLEGLALPLAPGQRFDGVSLLPALRGGSVAREAVYQFFPHAPGVPDWLPPCVSVHRGDWKLIRIFHGGERGAHRHLLFNLRDDLGERHNLAARQPALVRELDGMIENFLRNTGAVVPVVNPNFDPARYRPEDEGKQKAKEAKTGKMEKTGKTGKTGETGKMGETRKTGKTRETGETASIGSWQASRDARLQRGDGGLQILSTGGDPWISRRDLPAEARGPFTLQIRLKSSARGNAMVFFSATAGEAFHKERTVAVPVVHDGQFHDYEVALPARTLHALRLDPATGPGEITLAAFELRDASGKRIALLE